MAQASRVFSTGEQIVRALDTPDTAKLGSALDQLRRLCSIQPLPPVVLDYIRLEPSVDSIINLLNVAREANSIHLLANSLYTLSYLLSSLSSSPFEARQTLDGSGVINHLIQKHSKSIHRCFAPGRTEATVACLSLLISSLCWNEGSCAKIVISELKWDHKTLTRLLHTRHGLDVPNGRPPSNSTPAFKSSKLKGQLHKADIRNLMLRFIFSALSNIELRSSIKQELWKTKGLADGVFKGLQTDSYETVAFVLGNLWDIITRKDTSHVASYNRKPFTSHLELEMLDQNTIKILVELLDRDDKIKDIHVSNLSSTESIAQMVERFLENLSLYLADFMSTSIFHHHANSRLPQYRILSNVIKCLSPSKSMSHWRLSLHLLELIPTLRSTFWRTAAPAIEPLPTVAWISSVGFASKAASMPLTLPLNPETIPDHLNLNALPSLGKNLLSQCFPTPLDRIWFTKALQHSNAFVAFSSLTLLLAGLKKARHLSLQLENSIHPEGTNPLTIASEIWPKLLLAFRQPLQAILPDPQVLIAILQTSTRLENESKKIPLRTPENTSDELRHMAAAPLDNDGNGDIVIFYVLAVLLLYHQVVPQTMSSLNFDYTKLISTFFKLNLSTEPQSTPLPVLHRLQSPVVHLCQSRILILIGQSALTNLMQPSPALLKALLLLSSFPTPTKSRNHPSNFTNAPPIIKSIAQETLYTLCKSIAPHFRDEHECQELSIWLDTLSDLRTVDEDVTSLVSFMEDCMRACLRHPLKYIQISQEHRHSEAYIPWDGQVAVPILFSALLSKISMVTTGATNATANSSRLILISLIVKFSNLYLLNVLSAPHKTRPILMVHYLSCQLKQTLSNCFPHPVGDDEFQKYPHYLGDNIIHTLRSIGLLSTSSAINLARNLPNIPWPSYITQSSFSQHAVVLESIHQSLLPADERQKVEGKGNVTFMLPSSTFNSTNSTEKCLLLTQRHPRHIRLMTRTLELDKLATNVDHLHDVIKALEIQSLINMISKLFNDDPILIKCFLEETWDTSQFFVKQGDFQLLSDILCVSCRGLQHANKNEIKVITRYADLIIDSAHVEFLKGKVKLSSQNHALIQCACYLFPLLEEDSQSKVLVAILSHLDSTVLSDIGSSSSILKLLKIVLDLASQGKQSLLDRLSFEPVIKILCALSCNLNGQVATDFVLEIVERHFESDTPSIFSDIMFKSWSKYVVNVLESAARQQRDFGVKLRIISCLAQKNQEIASVAIRWLSLASMNDLQLAWYGTLSLLLACIGTLPMEKSRYQTCLHLLGESRLKELMDTIGTCLFFTTSKTFDPVLAKEKGIRVLAAKVLNTCCVHAIIDELLAEQLTQIDLIPAYSQTLDVLNTCGSRHLTAYIDRCLRWLVRRFAEDENMNNDTEELVHSLQEFLDQQSVEYILSAYLINPILSAVLDRWLHCPCVMNFVNSLIRHTKLKDAEVLKHVRATVESRNFRTLMRSSSSGEEGQDLLVISAINQLVVSCPAVASQAKLSSALIAFYGGTVSLKDRLIFQVFRIEDLWSDTSEIEDAISSWTPIIGNRRVTGKGLDCIALLDSAKVAATSVWMLNRYKSESFPNSNLYYDPSFLLHLLLHMIKNEKTFPMSTWYSIARIGLLGLAMCALSSDKTEWRFLGDRCLAKSYQRLKTSNYTDACEILLPMEHFRNLHRANGETGKIDPVPPLITLFFSRCIHLFCATPESSLHPPLTKFLLQRAIIDAKDVPMLYSLLYSSNEIPSDSHIWLIQLLHDGLCRTIDWKIMNHRQTFEILMTLVLSSAHRKVPKLRILLLQLMGKATSHNQACVKLVGKTGLLKGLKIFKPFSISEWEAVLKILQEVAARIPLLQYKISRESIGNIIDLLDDLVNDENCCNSQLAITVLLIFRSLLICHSFWRSNINQEEKIWRKNFTSSENQMIFLQLHQLVQKINNQNQFNKDQNSTTNIQNQKLIDEVLARIFYVKQL